MKLRYRVKCHMNITAHCVYTNTLITDWSLFKSFSVIPRTDLQFELFTGSNTKLCCRGVVPLKLMNGMWTLQLPGIIMWICATQPLKPLPGAFAEQEWDETEIIATAIHVYNYYNYSVGVGVMISFYIYSIYAHTELPDWLAMCHCLNSFSPNEQVGKGSSCLKMRSKWSVNNTPAYSLVMNTDWIYLLLLCVILFIVVIHA